MQNATTEGNFYQIIIMFNHILLAIDPKCIPQLYVDPNS